MTLQMSEKWSTKDELVYINTIGCSLYPSLPRDVMLENYLAANAKRSVWGKLDRTRILNHARCALTSLRAEIASKAVEKRHVAS